MSDESGNEHAGWVENGLSTHGKERISELCDTSNAGMLVLFCVYDLRVQAYLAIVRGHPALLLVVLWMAQRGDVSHIPSRYSVMRARCSDSPR